MSSRNFKKALREAEASQNRTKTIVSESMTDEEIREAAFQSRRNREANITQKMADDSTRNDLLRQSGFDYVDVEELRPHPENDYHFDEQDIEDLAGLIYTSKETQPLVVLETKDGLQIIDGERRWHAHKLLAKLHGDMWRMVPVRIRPLGSLTEEEVKYILHSNNMGQRAQTKTERIRGFSYVADRLVEWRKSNPALKGRKTKELLAERYNVSERTAQQNLTIAKGIIDRCYPLIDKKKITITQAEKIARLPEEAQNVIADEIESSELSTEDVDLLIEKAKRGEDIQQSHAQPKKRKDTNAYLKTAKNALKKASHCPDQASYKLLGEVKELIRDLEQIQRDLEARQTE